MSERNSDQLTDLTVDEIMYKSGNVMALLWEASQDCRVHVYGEKEVCDELLERAESAGIPNLKVVHLDLDPEEYTDVCYIKKDCDCNE